MGIFRNWLKNRDAAEASKPARPTGQTGSYRQRLTDANKSVPRRPEPEPELVDIDPHFHGTVESLGPGKNVYTPKRYVREETGTHETLKIIDDSLSDDEQDGFDPYNTGQFDLSRNWHLRAKK